MAKRKKQKESNKSSLKLGNRLIGLLLILLSITGFGSFGIVGGIVKKFAIFMFGTWSVLFLGLILLLGLGLLAKSEKINYFSSRKVGIYSLIIALLLFSHINYISGNDLNGKAILKNTMDNISVAFDTASEVNTGGGMVGALVSWAFVSLFDIEGSIIVMVIIILFGIIMLFDLTLSDIGKAIMSPFKKVISKDEEDDEEEETIKPSKSKHAKLDEVEDDEIDETQVIDKRVIITSANDAAKKEVPMIEEKKPEIVEEDLPPEEYVKPSIDLLDKPKANNQKANTEFINNNIRALQRVFKDFGMNAKVVEIHQGPAVTQYEMVLDRGTKVNKVLSISREIALALSGKEVRIEAPIPGKSTIGVEVPNQEIMAVSMREIMEAMSKNTKLADSKLAAPLGKDIMGTVKYVEINKTPHMLVAGATGSGKSVCINNIIMSIIMRTTPEEVKMVLVDPKKVEFSVYDGMPHLLTPVVTDPKKASATLQKIVVEMDNRFDTFMHSGTKNIGTYNEYVRKELKKNPDCGLKEMPFILVIIDELADLMLVAAKEVEESIMRITQLARAAGIHLIVATQRPSTDLITGVVKSNIPTRISFAVSSSIDSRTILDMTGAEKLLGKGDMLYKPMDDNNPTRIQGSFVSDGEIARVVDFIKRRSSGPRYSNSFENLNTPSSASGSSSGSATGDDGAVKDVRYDEIKDYAIRTGQISASLIQRKFSLGYNRAARIIDMFEEEGIVGPAKGSKPRDVLVRYGDEEGE